MLYVAITQIMHVKSSRGSLERQYSHSVEYGLIEWWIESHLRKDYTRCNMFYAI